MPIQIKQVQLVLFSSGIVVPNKTQLVNDIANVALGLFDGDPAVFPFPDEAPSNIPRIILKSKDESHILQIAPIRVDFIYNHNVKSPDSGFSFKELFDKFQRVFNGLLQANGCQFNRVAVVTHWRTSVSEDVAKYLSSRFLKNDSPFSDVYNLELHGLTKQVIADFKTNKWIRIKSNRPEDTSEKHEYISIDSDINTVAEELYKIDDKSCRKFLDESVIVTQKAIDLLFSGGNK